MGKGDIADSGSVGGRGASWVRLGAPMVDGSVVSVCYMRSMLYSTYLE